MDTPKAKLKNPAPKDADSLLKQHMDKRQKEKEPESRDPVRYATDRVEKNMRRGAAGAADASRRMIKHYRGKLRQSTMLYRTFDYIEQTIGQKLILRSPKMVSFADKDDISSWAIEALGILSNADLFRGTAEGMLDPKGVISIEQAIVLSYRGILLVQNRDEQNKS